MDMIFIGILLGGFFGLIGGIRLGYDQGCRSIIELSADEFYTLKCLTSKNGAS